MARHWLVSWSQCLQSHLVVPQVRATGRELSYALLLGITLCFANTFILLQKPSLPMCTVQRFSVGMGFCIIYSALLTKTNRISRIFDSASKSARRPNFISPKSQVCPVRLRLAPVVQAKRLSL